LSLELGDFVLEAVWKYPDGPRWLVPWSFLRESRSPRQSPSGLFEREERATRLRQRETGAMVRFVAARTPREGRKPRLTFGVDDPHGHHLYTLRQSRYNALAQDINDLARAAACERRALTVLDVGCGDGALLRYLETEPEFSNMIISAADLRVDRWLYKRDLLHALFIGDLSNGYSQISSNSYDVVVCEQVLEHLPGIDAAVATLARILKPGGKLVVGVPIFLPPLHLIRKYIIPKLDRIFAPQKSRGHEQAFSKFTIVRKLKQNQNLEIVEVRGFRVISGGLLRPLENYRWWWKLNRQIGALVPAACIEIQVIARKMEAA
jgi:2-polyprenyl-3-methyl-5-hydroxy-6-metoxy-1,4-benzoquinol methylase